MIFLVFQLQFKGVWNLIHVPKEMAWAEFWEKKNEEKKNDNAHRVAHSSIVSKLHTNLVNHITVITTQIEEYNEDLYKTVLSTHAHKTPLSSQRISNTRLALRTTHCIQYECAY